MLGLPAWEHGLFLLFQRFHFDGLNQLMLTFSSNWIWLPIIGWLLWRSFKHLKRRDFYLVSFMLVLLLAVSDSTTSYFFKNFIQRLRPCKMPDIKPYIENLDQGCGGKWGFFSSHSSNAAALVSFMGTFAFKRKYEWGVWGFVAVMVGLSRIYLGMHLPLDVLAGWAWGLSLAWAWRWMARHSVMGRVAS